MKKLYNLFEKWLQAFIMAMQRLYLRLKANPYIGFAFSIILLSTTEEITEIVMAWMPLIFLFAMLGVVLGLLRKFGKI